MAKRVAILVGSQTFQPGSGLLPLQGPANDLKAFGRLLSDPERGGFEVYEFLNEPGYEVLPEIEQALSAATSNDLFIVYYSGHGKLDRTGRPCLAMANRHQGALLATSIPARHLGDLVENSDCDQVILILDCCYSGAVGVRGDVESELRVVENAHGFYIMAASSDMQTAREEEPATGGAVMGHFTAALVSGIESGAADREGKGKVLLSDLRRHLEQVVTGQTPKFFARNASGDPLISLSPKTATQLLDAMLLDDLDAVQWHRRRGAVSALAGMLRDGDAAVRNAAMTALLRRLRQERDHEVLADLKSALDNENTAQGASLPSSSITETITPPKTNAAAPTRLPQEEAQRSAGGEADQKAEIAVPTVSSPLSGEVLFECPAVKRFWLTSHPNCKLIVRSNGIEFVDPEDPKYSFRIDALLLNKAELTHKNNDVLIKLRGGASFEIGINKPHTGLAVKAMQDLIKKQQLS